MDYATRAQIERNKERIVALEGQIALLTEVAQILLDRRRGRPQLADQQRLEELKETLIHGPSNGH